jgi:hypothetical protein
MRRKISSILILGVFLSLQFGKIVNYLYCKWQMEIVLNLPDCDCDDHLVALFDHTEDGENKARAKYTLNKKITEFSYTIPEIDLSPEYNLKKNRFLEFVSPLLTSFIPTPFQPPAA